MCTKSYFLIERFFCCCPLRIGSLIIGYLGLIGHCLHLSVTITKYEFMHTAVESSLYMSQSDNSTAFNYYAFRISQFLSVWIAYHVISIVCHCALLWGIHTAKSEFVMPWLVTNAIETTVVIVAGTIILIILCFPGVGDGSIFILVAILIVSYCLIIYGYMCVYSHYYELKSPNIPKDDKKSDPPAYISSVCDDKKNLTAISINQVEV